MARHLRSAVVVAAVSVFGLAGIGCSSGDGSDTLGPDDTGAADDVAALWVNGHQQCNGQTPGQVEASWSDGSATLTAHYCGPRFEDVRATSTSEAHYGGGGNLTDTYGFQCVELAGRWFHFRYGIDLPMASAYQACERNYAGTERTSNPVPGDLLVLNRTHGNPYGHIAVVTGVNGNSVHVLEQNSSCSGANTYSKGAAYCFIHANANGGTSGGGTVTPPPPPSAGGQCAASAYQGRQVWTCNGSRTARTKCDGAGNVQVEECPCSPRPVGQDDQCAFDAGWSCNDSNANGRQVWTCDRAHNARFKCDGNGVQEEHCGNGCLSKPFGTDDVCR